MPESVQRSVRFVQFRRLYTICTSAKSTDLAELIPSHHPSSSVFFFLRRLSRGDEGRSAFIFQVVFCEKAGQISWKSCEYINSHSQTPKDL